MGNSCLVCREGTVGSYGEWHWEFWGNTYRLVKCLSCESVFTDPMPDDVTLKKLYDANFDYRWYQDHYDAKLRDCRIRVHEYRDIMGRKVLDFGGGIGYFSEAAREIGLDSVTYDPFYNKEAKIGGQWDAVVALHVLEHSNNPDRTIDQMRRLLKPGGKLILAVPNLLSLGYKKLGMHWVWAQPPLLHIFHFTAKGLEILLKRHNFKDLDISYHERWDANLYSDVEHVKLFRIMDAAWATRPFNAISAYRKIIARINTIRRFKGLEKAMRNYNPKNENYAELQITASNSGEPFQSH